MGCGLWKITHEKNAVKTGPKKVFSVNKALGKVPDWRLIPGGAGVSGTS